MDIGIVGLGRMGGSMAQRLARGGVRVVGFDPAAGEGGEGYAVVVSLDALVAALPAPRVAWMMVPSGGATESTFEALLARLSRGDTLVDGGNAHYKDSQRRGALAAARGIEFVDCGVSGGVWGLTNGYALMYGGSEAAARTLAPYARILAPSPTEGWLHCGPVGSGHYVKMIHNGIEYGMMQAFAEGFALMKDREDLGLDVAAIAETWRHGSVVRSWLLDLTAEFLAKDSALDAIAPMVADSGEGRWTVLAAVEQGIPAPVLSLALMSRFASQGRDDYASKLLAMMRKGFGGHAVKAS